MCKCEKCGKEINKVLIDMFNYDGSDDYEKKYFLECAVDAIVIDTNSDWAGYELTDEERRETIVCPHCHQFPFDDTEEIQVYDIVRIVMFKGRK